MLDLKSRWFDISTFQLLSKIFLSKKMFRNISNRIDNVHLLAWTNYSVILVNDRFKSLLYIHPVLLKKSHLFQ